MPSLRRWWLGKNRGQRLDRVAALLLAGEPLNPLDLVSG